MARRRFYAPPEDIVSPSISLSVEETHHLARVLRLKPGHEAYVFDGCGREYLCRFLSTQDNRARLEILDELADEVESTLHLTLAQALAKGEKFDLVIQKATELGVSRISPLVTEHADVKLEEGKWPKRLERWRRISLEAVKQCGRRRLVEITVPLTLEEFLDENMPADSPSAGAMLVFSEKGGAPIENALARATDRSKVTALIGPEGGWGEAELIMLEGRGCAAVTLGPRTLRTETAAIVAIALIQHALGDLS